MRVPIEKLKAAAENIITAYHDTNRILPLAGGIPRPIEESDDRAVVCALGVQDLLAEATDDDEPITDEWKATLSKRRSDDPLSPDTILIEIAEGTYIALEGDNSVGIEKIDDDAPDWNYVALHRRVKTRGDLRKLLAWFSSKEEIW